MTASSDALVLIGAGRMGTALLTGWAARQMAGRTATVIEPTPSPALVDLCREHGIRLNPGTPCGPAGVLVLAVKPQTLDAAAPILATLAGPKTLVVSILAGKSLADLAARLPGVTAIVRAMPNTPAAIGRGISGLVATPQTLAPQREFAQRLLEAVGEAVWVPDEAQMDAVTAVSGSGPAYVFLFAEKLAEAGRAAGLPADLAAKLARKTVEGAAALMEAEAGTSPATLRENVTSPGGTTAAALDIFNRDDAFGSLIERAVARAVARGKELAG